MANKPNYANYQAQFQQQSNQPPQISRGYGYDQSQYYLQPNDKFRPQQFMGQQYLVQDQLYPGQQGQVAYYKSLPMAPVQQQHLPPKLKASMIQPPPPPQQALQQMNAQMAMRQQPVQQYQIQQQPSYSQPPQPQQQQQQQPSTMLFKSSIYYNDTKPPPCFDIIGKGCLPSVSFYTSDV